MKIKIKDNPRAKIVNKKHKKQVENTYKNFAPGRRQN